VTTTIDMAVSLPYSKDAFTEDIQTRVRYSIASAADVLLFRVIINSINEPEVPVSPNRRLLTVATNVTVDFSIRVPLDAPGMILTLSVLARAS